MPLGPLGFTLKDRLAARGVSTTEARRLAEEARTTSDAVRSSKAPEAPTDRPSKNPSDLALREALVRQALHDDDDSRRRDKQSRRKRPELKPPALPRELLAPQAPIEEGPEEAFSRAYAAQQHQRQSNLPADFPPSVRAPESNEEQTETVEQEAVEGTSETDEPEASELELASEPPPTARRRFGVRA